MSEDPEKKSAQPHKTLTIKEIERPKYPEMYSTEEKADWQPWRITLKVQLEKFDPEPVDYILYLRAASPYHAQILASGFFEILEHHHKGKTQYDYPQICEEGSTAEAISEHDYYAAWKDAQKPGPGRHFVKTGMAENPTIFRMWEDGWDEPHSDGIRHGASSIIVPSMADIACVSKQKQAIDRKFSSRR